MLKVAVPLQGLLEPQGQPEPQVQEQQTAQEEPQVPQQVDVQETPRRQVSVAQRLWGIPHEEVRFRNRGRTCNGLDSPCCTSDR
jgi:hypothetical protein